MHDRVARLHFRADVFCAAHAARQQLVAVVERLRWRGVRGSLLYVCRDEADGPMLYASQESAASATGSVPGQVAHRLVHHHGPAAWGPGAGSHILQATRGHASVATLQGWSGGALSPRCTRARPAGRHRCRLQSSRPWTGCRAGGGGQDWQTAALTPCNAGQRPMQQKHQRTTKAFATMRRNMSMRPQLLDEQ